MTMGNEKFVKNELQECEKLYQWKFVTWYIYKTYLKELIHDNLPSFEDFSEEYDLSRKGI